MRTVVMCLLGSALVALAGGCGNETGSFGFGVSDRMPDPPTVTAITNGAPASPHATTNGFGAAVPEPFTVTGTGFGPLGGTAHVRFASTEAIFDGGASTAATAAGTIVSPTTIEGTSPAAVVCAAATENAEVSVALPDGRVTPATTPAIFFAPTIDAAVQNVTRTTVQFFSTIPDTFRATGTDFGPVGGIAFVTFTSTTGTPFLAGTSAFVVVPAQVVDRTTIEGLSPESAMCPPAAPMQTAPPSMSGFDLVDVSVQLLGGSCTSAPASGVAFVGPLLDTPAVPIRVASTVRLGQTDPDAFTLTGQGFAPIGTTALVTFADPGGTAFDGAATTTVPALIQSETMLVGTLPIISSPRLPADLVADVAVSFPNGSCVSHIGLVTFVAPPTIASVVNNRAPFDPTNPAASIPDTWLTCVGTDTTINGTAFDLAIAELFYSTALGATTPIGSGVLEVGPPPLNLPRAVTSTTIAGFSPTDPTLTVATPTTLRIANPDGQFHTLVGFSFETTGALPNVNASINPLNADPNAGIVGSEAELSIAVDPTDPNNVAVVSQDTNSALTEVYFATSPDRGATFDGRRIGAAADGLSAAFRRESPQVLYDAFGNLYLVYGVRDPGSDSLFRTTDDFTVIRVLQSHNNGTSFSDIRSLVFPLSDYTQWTAAMGVDGNNTANQALYVTVVELSLGDILVAGYSVRPADDAVVALFAATSANAIPGIALPLLRQFGRPAPSVGPNGELYVTFVEGDIAAATPIAGPPFAGLSDIYVNTDRDGLGSATFAFSAFDVAVSSTDMPLDPVLLAPQSTRGKGVYPVHQVIPSGANAGRLVIAYETLDVLALASATPFLDTRVVTQYSDDRGATWSARVSVHGVHPGHQFHPWLAVDAATGRLHVTWNDTRNDATENRRVQRYAASSADGAGWSSLLLLSQGVSDVESDTTPDPINNPSDDYKERNGVAVYNGCVYAAWADNSDLGNNNGDDPADFADGFDPFTTLFMQR